MITKTEQLKKKYKKVEIFGDGDKWQLICKVETNAFMKSTKAMVIKKGLLVQVTTLYKKSNTCAEALVYIENASIQVKYDGTKLIV